MVQTNHHLIEDYTPLSESSLWDIQRRYFNNRGVDAFTNEVPFYVSSNNYIATRYAEMLHLFINQSITQDPTLASETFNILELGAGTGKFSFYFLKAFSSLVTQSNSSFKWRYIISDFVKSNVEKIEKQSKIQRLLNENEIDFSHVDVESDNDIFLLKKQCVLDKTLAKAPLIIIANYIFDCVKQDLFTKVDDELAIEHIALTSTDKAFDIKKPTNLKNIKFKFKREKILNIDTLYDIPLLNEILKAYSEKLETQTSFPIPVAAFEFIEKLRKHFSKLLIVMGDKGISSLEHFPIATPHQHFSYDGCYSLLVNFHALGTYCLNSGGDYLKSSYANNFKINLFSLGFTLNQHLALKQFHQFHLEHCAADDFCSLMTNFEKSSHRFDAKGLIAFLRLSYWDPDVFNHIYPQLLENVGILGPLTLKDLIIDLKRVEKNIYPLKDHQDIYLLLGVIYQELKLTEEAKECYNKSIEFYGESPEVHHNLGILYEEHAGVVQASQHYQQALALNKSDSFAKQRLNRLNGRFLNYLLPVILKLCLVLGVGLGLYWIVRK